MIGNKIVINGGLSYEQDYDGYVNVYITHTAHCIGKYFREGDKVWVHSYLWGKKSLYTVKTYSEAMELLKRKIEFNIHLLQNGLRKRIRGFPNKQLKKKKRRRKDGKK